MKGDRKALVPLPRTELSLDSHPRFREPNPSFYGDSYLPLLWMVHA